MAKKSEEAPVGIRRYIRPGESEKLRKEGEEGGNPEIGFDLNRMCNYHLNTLGEPVFHGVPEGFAFDEQGRLRPLPPHPSDEAAVEQPTK